MEKQGYREQLELLLKMFPCRAVLTVREVAQVMSCDPRTVRATILRKQNPLPARNVASEGSKKAVYVVPVTAFARWLS